MNGTIKKKTDRGFGFIARDGESKDLFFHSNDLVGISFDELREGTPVTFEVERGDKGPSAKNVRVADSGNNTEVQEDQETSADVDTASAE